MNILIMGGPGAGKGTMSLKIVEKFNVLHISTGDIFRSEIGKQTALGMEAKKYMDQGLLVPDEVTNPMVKSFIEKQDIKNGYLLDGYPRTLAQAKAFDELVKGTDMEIDKVLTLEIPFEKLAVRITGRRLCKGCDAIYHIDNHPSKEEGICDICGSELYQRDDDTVESLSVRLEEYSKNADPILDYYGDRVVVINADQSADEVWQDIQNALGGNA
ncbi:adenylate kinase [Breznakia sp. PF5-3]|uniref:adenylate kinase n=1 Tax=unclassified Breznakia TaxID=2623764 RepID=UPI002405116A|nr:MULTISPECIES: adenylate kinase [unclassified Breznakia]MDL2276637.1 adenylate kinase [Breznakia sp. OttesenSCG-928-G09]MDF9825151.1 adenylate kinase [Breznakia sp. PM6-1]MDF9835990.1 adenylate kinase [Breznakia sp. PF5-3]MDF9838088.1 adenylate kinase [Breznakia sp. PFB2-8]MDF9860082.1 adenylate kinase [Breznakia sp. PH5-24]